VEVIAVICVMGKKNVDCLNNKTIGFVRKRFVIFCAEKYPFT
jgi:hypothetical protein